MLFPVKEETKLENTSKVIVQTGQSSFKSAVLLLRSGGKECVALIESIVPGKDLLLVDKYLISQLNLQRDLSVEVESINIGTANEATTIIPLELLGEPFFEKRIQESLLNKPFITGQNAAIITFKGIKNVQVTDISPERIAFINEETKIHYKADKISVGVSGKNKTDLKIEKFGRDITELAGSGNIDPVIGRQDEINLIIQTLSRKTKNNPLLIGEAGVGKTAVVEGLALFIHSGNVIPYLKNKRIIELNMGQLVAGTQYRGEFEERLMQIIDEAKQHPDIILFIDEVHTVISAGAAQGAVDAANILKPPLARGEIRLIGATTMSEYHKYVEKDAALERRFEPIVVKEPTPELTIEILTGLKNKYEEYHNLKIKTDAIEEAVKLSCRFLIDRHLPDKALDLLDAACGYVKTDPDNLFRGIVGRKEVTREIIAKVLAKRIGIPEEKLTEGEKDKLVNMEAELKIKIIGQDKAVEKISRTIKMARAGLKDPKRPTGVFLFLGPTGVGKTKFVKCLAEFLFGSEDDMIRFDMSEFMEEHSVAKLIGSPPGYVGYDEEGQLSGKIRRKPYSVILLDEIEKAHPKIFDLFLQVFDEGRFADAKGRTIDARNSVFIMTSNLGVKKQKEEHFGFSLDTDSKIKTTKDVVRDELKKYFRPEFINRIDDVVPFNSLTMENLKKIVFLQLDGLYKRLRGKQMTLEIEEEAVEFLIRVGYDPENGARPLNRAIEQHIAQPLSVEIINGNFTNGDAILCKLEGEMIIFKKIGQ